MLVDLVGSGDVETGGLERAGEEDETIEDGGGTVVLPV